MGNMPLLERLRFGLGGLIVATWVKGQELLDE